MGLAEFGAVFRLQPPVTVFEFFARSTGTWVIAAWVAPSRAIIFIKGYCASFYFGIACCLRFLGGLFQLFLLRNHLLHHGALLFFAYRAHL